MEYNTLKIMRPKGMAKIKLRIVGSLQIEGITKEGTINVDNISEIIRQIEMKYPEDQYFNFNIFLNGLEANDKSKSLQDGDEVVIVPVMVGG